ncbi:hypothetical protein [Tolypothrix sp. VBCCA 56010]|uniref:hypothetical protein n=1 Tax=Tolypothrix sp. VBCCA 56010 TaxID=3137731 RepID=UPI003D7DF6CA
MGNWAWGMGHGAWGQGELKLAMPNDGRCYNAGNPRNALPPQCPMTAGATTRGTRATHCLPNAHCPMPYAQFSIKSHQHEADDV